MLALIAILPWQGALRFPTHSITIVKLVGALLFLSLLLATLLHDRRLRFTPPNNAPSLGSMSRTCDRVVSSPNDVRRPRGYTMSTSP